MGTPCEDIPCERCGGVANTWFAEAVRHKELKNGRPDPGILCGSCAGSDTGKRIAKEILDG